MYVPSERNLLSFTRKVKDSTLDSKALSEFLIEFDKASETIKNEFELPINNAKINYDRLNRNLNITGEDYRIRLSHSSSGFQSLVPLFIVTYYLSHSLINQKEQPMSSDAMNKFKKEMELIMTTHSPYILSYLNLALQAESIWERIKDKKLENTLASIVPINATVKASELNVYECSEVDGSIKRIKSYEGILPDDNYLNRGLQEGNDLFDALLDIEDQL